MSLLLRPECVPRCKSVPSKIVRDGIRSSNTPLLLQEDKCYGSRESL